MVQLAEAAGLPCAEVPAEGIGDGYEFPTPYDSTSLRGTALNPILITASFGHFVPPELLRSFSVHGRGRTLNVHPSFLPKLRSGAPIPWSIVRNRAHPAFPLTDAFRGGSYAPLEAWSKAASGGFGTGKSEIPAYGVTVQELSPDGFDKGAVLYQEALAGGDSLVRVSSLLKHDKENTNDERQRLVYRARRKLLDGVQSRVILPSSAPLPESSFQDTSEDRGRGVTSYERWTYRSALLVLAHLGGRALVATLRDLSGHVDRSVSQSEISQTTGCLPTNAFKRQDPDLHIDFGKHDAVHFEALYRAWGFHHQAKTVLYTAELVYPLERKSEKRKNPVPSVKSISFSIGGLDVLRTSEMDPETVRSMQKALMFTHPDMYSGAPRPEVSKDCVNVTRIRPAEPGDMIFLPDIAPSATAPVSILPPGLARLEDARRWAPEAIELQAVSSHDTEAILAQRAAEAKLQYAAEQETLYAELTQEKKHNAELDALLEKSQQDWQDGTKTAAEVQAIRLDIKKQKAASVLRRKKQREERAQPGLVIKCAPGPPGSEADEAFLVVRQYRLGDGRKWRSVTSDTWNGLWERADELKRLNLRSSRPDLYQVLLKQREMEHARRVQQKAQLK